MAIRVAIIIITIGNQIVKTGSDSLLGPWYTTGGTGECEFNYWALAGLQLENGSPGCGHRQQKMEV